MLTCLNRKALRDQVVSCEAIFDFLHIASAGCRGEIRLGPVLVDDDPLEAIPQPFRFWLSLRSRPYRVWAASPYNVEIKAGEGASSNQVRGSGETAVTFLNPAPASIAVGHSQLPGV